MRVLLKEKSRWSLSLEASCRRTSELKRGVWSLQFSLSETFFFGLFFFFTLDKYKSFKHQHSVF